MSFCSICGIVDCQIKFGSTISQIESLQHSTGGFLSSLKNPDLHLLGISCQAHIEARKRELRLNLETAEKRITEMAGNEESVFSAKQMEMLQQKRGQFEQKIQTMRIELGLEVENEKVAEEKVAEE